MPKTYLTTLEIEVCFAYFKSAMDHLQLLYRCNGKVTTIGFCFGGKLVYPSLARHGAGTCYCS
ncbi:MAG: dienelactone hydrolase family protein [Pseudomonadota bacterium]|nr:dienelactone hydrolase family protein [Pseudomonadota bacterium]